MLGTSKFIKIIGLAAVLGLLTGLAACGGEVEAPIPEELPTPKDPPSFPEGDTYKLTIIGWKSLNLVQGQSVTLQVLYTKNDVAVASKRVDFALKSPSGTDSKLSSSWIYTGAGGFAEVILTAGQLTGPIAVTASAERAKSVSWSATVQEKAAPTPTTSKLEGTLGVTNHFNIKTDFTGSKLADVLNVLDKISDDPQDPGKFVVDTVLDKVDNKAVLAVAMVLKPTLYKEVNDLLYKVAPNLVATIKQLAQDLSTIARKFELDSSMTALVPQPGDKPMSVEHKLHKVAWTIGGKRTAYTFSQLNLKDPVASNVQLTLANGNDLTVREHSFKFNYGAFVLVALNEIVIPKIEPGAQDIHDLLKAHIDCVKVGKKMNTTVGLGGDTLWTGACNIGLKAVATYLEFEIAAIGENETKLTLKGQAKLYDNQKSGSYTLLTKGAWTGSFELEQCKAPIMGPGNRFYGEKLASSSN